MPIVFSAITPHPPVLIPEIGKEHLEKLSKTVAAYKMLEQEFYAAKPESVVLISPHGNVLDDAFSINLNASYKGDFSAFGNFSFPTEYRSDYMSIQKIRAADETRAQVPLVLTSQDSIDHGFAVPLFYLLAHLKDVPIIPITFSGLDYAAHIRFGQFLHEQLSMIDKRFAVIASADLSHRVTKDAPAGFSQAGPAFDTQVIDALKAGKFDQLVQIDPANAAEAAECGLRAILILAGALHEMPVQAEVLSYEAPFGVGYGVVNLKVA